MTIEEQSDVMTLALRLNSVGTLCRLMEAHLHEGSGANVEEAADVFAIVRHVIGSAAEDLSVLSAGK